MSNSLTIGVNYFRASGASTASGVQTFRQAYTKLYSILAYPISGAVPNTSSGLGLAVYDAVSGMANVNSGNLVWSYNFGSQSGGFAVYPYPPQLPGPLDLVCLSGVVLQTTTGWVLEIVHGG